MSALGMKNDRGGVAESIRKLDFHDIFPFCFVISDPNRSLGEFNRIAESLPENANLNDSPHDQSNQEKWDPPLELESEVPALRWENEK
jgi:hypothetical protein